MIIAKRFSLGHIPRTAGSKTTIILSSLYRLLEIKFLRKPFFSPKTF